MCWTEYRNSSQSSLSSSTGKCHCPQFHCTREATGVMAHAITGQAPVVNSNSALGSLRFQGCSGDGVRLSCLFASDSTIGLGRGTLKVLNASTLTPVWGSAGAPKSYDLDANDVAGQVPLNFADGRLAAGDSSFHVLYDASGVMLAKLPVGGTGTNFGLTPISAALGIVSQSDGVLTLVNMASWQNAGTLVLRDPETGAAVRLVSPSSASADTLFAVGFNPKNNHGFLFAVTIDPSTRQIGIRTTWVFTGVSGASPVVVAPAVTGLPRNLVLLHVPGLPADAVPRDRLLGLLDTGNGMTPLWTITLDAALPVAPTIDSVTQTLFFVYSGDGRVFQHSLLSGARLRVFDVQAATRLPGSFVLNGHLGASQAWSGFTLLLSGKVSSAAPGSNGQYVIAFRPGEASPVMWVKRINARADLHTAAWNLAPSSQPDVDCAVVVGTNSGITRLCDFAP